MSIPLILCLTTLTMFIATAASGIAIAVLERRGVVPRLVERAFMGFAGAGSAVLVASVVMLHPLTADAVVGGPGSISFTGRALAADIAADIAAEGDPACVSLSGLSAYDRVDARYEGDDGKGVNDHEVSVFRSPGSR